VNWPVAPRASAPERPERLSLPRRLRRALRYGGPSPEEFVERRKVFSSNAHYLDLKGLLETHLIGFFGEEALKRAGIRGRKPYQTRHTFATLALSAGEAIG
jgi:integrase